ncbi:hypothetical protein [Marinobacter sp. F4216]|uniref:hypothetical protein n=1 Tax=Marinobacter sp. F4216 TaxID=2874281 RepID=UPI001CBC450B|nr:hypothetical protein [Marinobacter sp. F4216]MBZ2170259.1 hypothetical protein [Marinobacter sp. F4216]
MSVIVNTDWQSEPEIFIGTITSLTEIPTENKLPVLELTIENSFETYQVVMFQPHSELQLTEIPDLAVQLVLWKGKPGAAVSRSDSVILLDSPYTLLHLPESKLHYPDIPLDIEQFIEDCPQQALIEFVRRVLGRPSVGLRFMNAPMLERGYQTPGSLALHSLDVAMRSFDACHGFTEEERWQTAIAGLLQGVGRIELEGAAQTDPFKVVLKTLDMLSKELDWLKETNREAARMIQLVITSMHRIGKYDQPHPSAMTVQMAHIITDHLRSERVNPATRYRTDSSSSPFTL